MKQQAKIVSQLTLTAAHKQALRRLAAAEHETMAQVVRDLIKEAARRRGLWPALTMEESLVQEGIPLEAKEESHGRK